MIKTKKILFVHQDFPGQFANIIKALLCHGHEIYSLGINRNYFFGVKQYFYTPERSSTQGIHPWLIDFESQVIRAQSILYEAHKLKSIGFYPDLLIVHPGWGEALFLKEVWPNSKLILYCEFFYHAAGADIGFDPEFTLSNPEFLVSELARVRLKNLANSLVFDSAVAGISPTNWQKSLFPEIFRSKISVIHDGIDTELLAPNKSICIRVKKLSGTELIIKKGDEIITFVNRNLEPYRGYHIFMRALPKILQSRPSAQVLIIGADGTGYGPNPPNSQNWRTIFLNEVRQSIDINRVHFLGHIPYEKYINVLQISAAHVYLTYPFVLSWSLLEAMSIGCPIVGSNTEPVQELIFHKKNGILVDFFDTDELANSVIKLLSEQSLGNFLGNKARIHIQENYDSKNICMPKQLNWISQFF